jgi:hypothetical protein
VTSAVILDPIPPLVNPDYSFPGLTLFQRHRHLLKRLCTLAHESLKEYLRTALNCPEGVPGIIMTLQTFGEYLDFHPHMHALVADGLFVRSSEDPGGARTQTLHSQKKDIRGT